MPKALEVFAGQRFGRLVATETTKSQFVDFLCDCGRLVTKQKRSITSGKVKSCGCLSSELKSIRGRERKSHGLTKSTTYTSWRAMHSRCTNPKAYAYERYGGAGIDVCERWKSFESFLQDMGHRPEGTSLDRIDGSKGYSKENCRWASRKEQSNNTRANVLMTAFGKTQTLGQWADELGIKYVTLYRRVNHCGWPHEKALTTPVRK